MEATNKLVLDRVFDAPIKTVWMAFSKAEYLSVWWGPTGFETIVKHFDFQVGGRYHFAMKGADGTMMWALFRYEEIDEHKQIVFLTSFSDEVGAIAKAPAVPFGEHWPLEIRNHITFEDLGEQTRVQLVGTPINVTTIEEVTFVEHIGSMQSGFGAAFDRLKTLLETHK